MVGIRDHGVAVVAPDSESESGSVAVPESLAGMRLDQALAKMFAGHSRSRLSAWIRDGRVTVDGATVDAKRKVWGGERVALTPGPLTSPSTHRAEAIPLSVVHEDEAILVLDKPAGLVVHPGSGNWQGTMLNALLAHTPSLDALPRAGIVHRLDKDTSGLLVVAKSEQVQLNLVRQLQARTVKRDYIAVVHGRVAVDGSVEAPIGRDSRVRTRMAVVAGGRPARTHYRVMARFSDASLLECSLDTGRTHQIRVHMRSIGHPIMGDATYGPRATGSTRPIARQALHAARLGLIHPVHGCPVSWQSDLPADIDALIRALRAGITSRSEKR